MIYLIALVGQLIGLILAKLTKEELKPGRIYFKILKTILLIIIIISTLYCNFMHYNFIYYNFNIFYLITGLILGLIIRKEYFYFGLISNNLLFSSLIFIYGLPYGTLKPKITKLIFNTILFTLTLIINFIYPINLSLATGALMTILIKNINKKFQKFRSK